MEINQSWKVKIRIKQTKQKDLLDIKNQLDLVLKGLYESDKKYNIYPEMIKGKTVIFFGV